MQLCSQNLSIAMLIFSRVLGWPICLRDKAQLGRRHMGWPIFLADPTTHLPTGRPQSAWRHRAGRPLRTQAAARRQKAPEPARQPSTARASRSGPNDGQVERSWERPVACGSAGEQRAGDGVKRRSSARYSNPELGLTAATDRSTVERGSSSSATGFGQGQGASSEAEPKVCFSVAIIIDFRLIELGNDKHLFI